MSSVWAAVCLRKDSAVYQGCGDGESLTSAACVGRLVLDGW